MANTRGNHPRPVFIAGPTASGKSEIALALAEIINGEIISVDSMQVYRGLDIGTAKPSAADQKRVPHHLVDCVDLAAPFDAAKFLALAQTAVEQIQSRGRTPVFCGGTGLYFKAWLAGIGDAPAADAALRAELEAAPQAELLRELELRDAATFAKIDRQNPRRVIRAVEVIRLSGGKFSEQRAGWAAAGAADNFFVLSRGAADLQARINGRVDRMFAAGLVEEVRRLLADGLGGNRTAMQAIGYRQVVEHLRGERALAATVELVKGRTRQFAKRQLTWFRGQLGAEWVSVLPEDPAAAVAEKIVLLCARAASNVSARG